VRLPLPGIQTPAWETTGRWLQSSRLRARFLSIFPGAGRFESGKKKVLVVEARSGKFITNVWPLKVNNDCGDFVFEASEAPGDYYFYYLPYKIEGKSYPVVTYLAADYEPEKTWLERYGLSPVPGSKLKPSSLPRAELIAFEAVDDFSRFYPMEVIATSEETAKIIETYKSEPF